MCDAALRVQLPLRVTLDARHGFVSQRLAVQGTAPVAEADEQLHHLREKASEKASEARSVHTPVILKESLN